MMVTRATYDRLVQVEEKMAIIPIQKSVLRDAFSLIANKIRLMFNANERLEHKFYIEKMAYDLILSIDFLAKYAVTMETVNTHLCSKRSSRNGLLRQ